jgi:hypothetical protein
MYRWLNGSVGTSILSENCLGTNRFWKVISSTYLFLVEPSWMITVLEYWTGTERGASQNPVWYLHLHRVRL